MHGTKMSVVGHDWDTLLHMNFADLHMTWQFNALIMLKKKYALGRSLVIFKIPLSRSYFGGRTLREDLPGRFYTILTP